MSRWKASAFHLLISLVIVGCIAAWLVGFWYPPALMHMANTDKLLMLIAGVDLVIGPLLTLIIYRHDKPGVKTDLMIIGLLQTGFLVYGLHSIVLSRPVFIVASVNRFDMVFANELPPERLAAGSAPAYRDLGFTSPRIVGAIMPADPKEAQAVTMSALSGQGDLQTMPRYYVDYSRVAAQMLAASYPLAYSKLTSRTEIDRIIAAARDYGKSPDTVRWLHLASSRGLAVMLIDARNGAVIGPVNADP